MRCFMRLLYSALLRSTRSIQDCRTTEAHREILPHGAAGGAPTGRYARSSAPSVVEQRREAVRGRRRPGRQREISKAAGRLPNLKRLRSKGYNPRHRPVTVEHGDCPPLPNGPKMLAQSRLKICDSNRFHDYILVTTGQMCPLHIPTDVPSQIRTLRGD